MRVAFLSGGKDSYYAVYRYGLGVDLGLMLVYDFPRPSPHLVNLGKSVETILLTGIPILVVKLSKGRELVETVSILRKLNADTIVAGDVYIEDHLRYMEKVAGEAGATLVEPLWGLDPGELLYKELEDGVRPLIIGCVNKLSSWLGVELNLGNVEQFTATLRTQNIDPLGERGEYHTLVLTGPLHREPLKYEITHIIDYEDYKILRLL